MKPIKLFILSAIIIFMLGGCSSSDSESVVVDNDEVSSDPSFPVDPNKSLKDTVQILGWWSIPYKDASVARYKEMKDCGFTISFSATVDTAQVVKELEYADTAGMKCMVQMDYNDPIEATKRYMSHKSLYAYWIYDEPACSLFAELGAGVRKIKQVDSKHICYINLLPSMVDPAAVGATSYSNYMARCIKEVGCDIMSYDNYAGSHNVMGDFYNNLELAYKVCQQYKTPLWAFALATAHGSYPLPSIGKLRVQQNSNLAYGCDVLQYFTYWNPTTEIWDFHEAPIRLDGTQGYAYKLVQQVNKEIQKRAFVYHNAKVVNVWHTGKVYDGCADYFVSKGPSIVKSLSAPSGACISLMQKNGWDYLMIVSHNDTVTTQHPNKLSITFSKKVERIDTNGNFTYLTQYNNQPMEAGEAVIFGWKDEE
jgi:hypothetical protein